MWTRHKQQQQRGVQFRPQPGAAPEEAVADRSAQDREQAVVAVSPPEDADATQPRERAAGQHATRPAAPND